MSTSGGAKIKSSTSSAFMIPEGGSRDGTSESPHSLKPSLSSEAGHKSSKPPPSFVVTQSRTACDAKANAYPAASRRRPLPKTTKKTKPTAAAKTSECVNPLCQALEPKAQTSAKSKSAAFARKAPASKARR